MRMLIYIKKRLVDLYNTMFSIRLRLRVVKEIRYNLAHLYRMSNRGSVRYTVTLNFATQYVMSSKLRVKNGLF